jgi:hypothetical protein
MVRITSHFAQLPLYSTKFHEVHVVAVVQLRALGHPLKACLCGRHAAVFLGWTARIALRVMRTCKLFETSFHGHLAGGPCPFLEVLWPVPSTNRAHTHKKAKAKEYGLLLLYLLVLPASQCAWRLVGAPGHTGTPGARCGRRRGGRGRCFDARRKMQGHAARS